MSIRSNTLLYREDWCIMNNVKIPDWIKLDNAATIYPSTLTKRYASMFRVTITLNEKIDKDILNIALNNVIDRFPSFRYKLKQGLFWCYFKHIDGIPDIKDDYKNPMLRINFKENNNFMFRIRCFDKRIAIEYFHALTDGTGGITFLLTLTGEYLKLKHNIKINYNSKVLNPTEKPAKDEYQDSFKKYANGIGFLEKETAAYHLSGTIEDSNMLNIITGTISIKDIKKKCMEYNSSVTEFIVSLLLFSLQEIQERDKIKQKFRKPIKISVPVNLRNIYPSNTMRNFSSYINVGIETKYGHYSLEEIISEVKSKMSIMLNKNKIHSKISANVRLANNPFVRIIPMFIKKHILSICENLMGDRYNSTTFSNLGLIDIPDEVSKYVRELGFIIGRSRNKSGTCACISYKNNLYISFSRKIKESEFERLFFTKLVEMGIPVVIESNIGR